MKTKKIEIDKKNQQVYLWHMILLLIAFTCSVSVYGQQRETYVIVHGAWGGSWSFKQVDSLLRLQGHMVYRPSLTGQGERVHLASTAITLDTHILDVVNTVLYENLRDIVLVGHSYGGMVISGVADSIPERIKRLVYLDAFVPNNGESVFTSRNDGRGGPELHAEDGFVKPNWIKDTDPLPKDVPQSVKTFSTPVSWSKPQALALPATYIFTIDDPTYPERDGFYFFAERAKQRGWKLVKMFADHNPQNSKPEELVDILIQD